MMEQNPDLVSPTPELMISPPPKAGAEERSLELDGLWSAPCTDAAQTSEEGWRQGGPKGRAFLELAIRHPQGGHQVVTDQGSWPL